MIQLFAPLVTPFQSDESIDEKAFVENFSRYGEAPLDGYLINGSSGEAEMLTQDERVRLVRLAVEQTDRKIIAGVAATSVRATLDELSQLAKLPLEAVLVRTPSYFGGQLDQVSYYREVAKASSFPVMVYQIPQCTGVRLTGSELGRIAGFENVYGVKDSLGDLSLLNEVKWPDGFRYFLGASALIQPGIAAGARGGILALANVVPELCRALLQSSADPERRDEARELQQRLIPLNRLIGGSRGFGIAGLKAACEMRGYKSGAPRRPLRGLSEAQRKELEEVVTSLETGL